MRKYTHILWDWNGTLFDDLAWCIDVVNRMLVKRGLPEVSGVDAYHAAFRFPVQEYYAAIGFDFEREPFRVIADEFMALYHCGDEVCPLHNGAAETLAGLQALGVRQAIISASRQDHLEKQFARFPIGGFFDAVRGIGNIYAASKEAIARAYVEKIPGARALFIGDTVHDYEVASAAGVDCVLVASGHQSREKLFCCGVRVFNDLLELVGYFALLGFDHI